MTKIIQITQEGKNIIGNYTVSNDINVINTVSIYKESEIMGVLKDTADALGYKLKSAIFVKNDDSDYAELYDADKKDEEYLFGGDREKLDKAEELYVKALTGKAVSILELLDYLKSMPES